MEVNNKLKALGYKEEHINGECALYFKNDKLIVARDGKDITELNIADAHYIKISKCSKISIINIRNKMMKDLVKYYIDENNNMFIADWAMNNRSYWMSLTDNALYYYNKKSNFKCVVNMTESQYSHLLMCIDRQGIVCNLIDEKYLLLGGYLIDLEKREVITFVRNMRVYEKVTCFGIDASSKLCNMFYSFEHKEFFKCTGVGYSLGNIDDDKNYIEYNGYRKSGEETYHVTIRSKEKSNTDLVKAIRLKEKDVLSMNKSNEGWRVSIRYQ